MRKDMPNKIVSRIGIAPALMIVALLAACTSNPQKAEEGKFRVGSLQTQIAGGDPKLAAPGQLVGAFLGKGIEAPLDESDKPLAEQALRKAYAMEVLEKSPWSNDKTGHSGWAMSTKEGWGTSGSYCREFQETAVIGKDTYQGYGAACKQADGTWKRIDPKEMGKK